jgi:hypothetical protein
MCVRPQKRTVRGPCSHAGALCSHAARIWQFYASAFDRNSGTFDRNTALLLCQRGCARTQTRDELVRRRARSRIGGSAFDRKNCVRPHCLHFEFSKNRQNAKNNLKKNELKGQIKFEQNLQCRKIKTSRKIHQSKNYANF